MKVDVLMPKMGESITEGRIIKWLKQPGDTIDRDETILEIATDKVDTEVPAPNGGVLVQILVGEGETVEVGSIIAVIETEADEASPIETVASPPDAAATPEPVVDAESTDGIDTSTDAKARKAQSPGEGKHSKESTRFFSPVVMRIAAEHNIPMHELESIDGSGMNGRVSKKDILAWIEKRESAPPAPASPAPESASYAVAASSPRSAGDEHEIIPMSNMHRLMAEHMVQSVRISPHVSVVSEVDMSRIVTFRDTHAAAFKQREGFTLTYMPFIAEATIRAIKDFPLINSSIDGENIVLKRMVNLGIAVAMDDGGLIVPVVKHADNLNVVGLGRTMSDIAYRARIRKLQPEEIQDGTFTITNFGVFGNIFGTPIINQPQMAILGVGAVQKKPVVIEHDGSDTIAIRSMMYISLAFDHRIIDGALGGRFLERVRQYLEEFNLDSSGLLRG